MANEKDKLILEKLKKVRQVKQSASNLLVDKINELDKILTNDYFVTRNQSEVLKYLDSVDIAAILICDNGISIYKNNDKPIFVTLKEKELQTVFTKVSTRFILFNAHDQLKLFKNYELKLRWFWDCLIAAKLLNENEETNNLLAICENYKLANNISIQEDILLIPEDILIRYECYKVQSLYKLYDFQSTFLNDSSKLKELYNLYRTIELPIINVLLSAEANGILIDVDKLNSMIEENESNLDKIKSKLDTELNKYSNKVNIYTFNYSSVEQLANLLYDIIGLPQINGRSVDENTLIKLDTELTKMLIEYKKIQVTISYLTSLKSYIKEDNKIHCKFNSIGTATGRITTNDPNLQGIRKDLRCIFIPDNGYTFISGDFSQQEIRIMAQLCNDNSMKKEFESNSDFYAHLAFNIFNNNITYDECADRNSIYRNQAKSILLGILYGRGDQSVAEQLNCSLEEARKIRNQIFSKYPAIEEFEINSIKEALESNQVVSIYGRKRRFKYSKEKEASIKRQAVNSKIQMSAADVTKKALILVHRNQELRNLGVRILNTIHDEILIECPTNNIDKVIPVFKNCMETCCKDKITIPMICNTKIFEKNWK